MKSTKNIVLIDNGKGAYEGPADDEKSCCRGECVDWIDRSPEGLDQDLPRAWIGDRNVSDLGLSASAGKGDSLHCERSGGIGISIEGLTR